MWRWAVGLWVVAVSAGGGLTLWLRDTADPKGPYSRQQSEPDVTPPGEAIPYDEYADKCPRAEPDDPRTGVACVYAWPAGPAGRWTKA